MDTQTVQIEPYDSVESLVEKITHVDPLMVLLLDHSENDLARSEVKVSLLIRKCLAHGKQISLVTGDHEAARLWQEKGLSVFPDVISAKDMSWRTISASSLFDYKKENPDNTPELIHLEKPRQNRQIPQAVRILIFLIAILSVISTIVILIPSTRVVLELPRQEIPLEIPVRVSSTYDAVSISGQIPAEIKEEAFSIIRSAPSSGSGDIAIEKAVGTVEFKNLSEREVIIPRGTNISTGGDTPILFTTDRELILEGRVGSAGSVEITAKEAGLQGNVPVGSIRQVEDALGVNVSVNNPNPASGGGNVQSPIATEDDRSSLHSQVYSELETSIYEKIQSTIGLHRWIIPESFLISKTESEKYYPPIGTPGDTVTLEVVGNARMLVVNESDLLAYLTLVLDKDPLSKFNTNQNGIQIRNFKCNTTDSHDIFSCKVIGSRSVISKINTSNLVYQISWMKPDEAITFLSKSIEINSTPEIINNPSWWPWVAGLPMQIRVEVK